jgi:hypothetical protein
VAENHLLGRQDDAQHVRRDHVEYVHARATAEKDQAVAPWGRSGFMQKRDEAAPHERISPVAIVCAHVGAPQFGETSRLRPQADQIVIIIRDDDPSA